MPGYHFLQGNPTILNRNLFPNKETCIFVKTRKE